MKKKIVVLSIAFIATVGIVAAQNNNNSTKQPNKSCYVDANANGTCDKHESGDCKIGSGKKHRVCDGSGRKNGKGKNAGKGLRDGSGRGNGGREANYVDANKNGICDNKEKTAK